MVSALHPVLSDPVELWLGHCVVFLEKTLCSYSISLHTWGLMVLTNLMLRVAL